MTDFTPRPSQKKILRYRGGRLGIAAVPGAGKTYTLSALAADLIARGALGRDQEVLIVTLVNSAVDNFSHRIGAFVQQRGLIPHLGYRVRTLHGLAHDIVREKPGRVGLEERFSIVDEREADFIRREAARAWLAAHPYDLDGLLDPALEGSRLDWIRKQPLPELLDSLALAFIRSSKDRRLTPDDLRARLEAAPAPLPLAALGLEIYSDYQRALAYRGAVDFDDLIRLALDLIERDEDFLARLRFRFPYILEDEAQDSSELQEAILGRLAGPDGNWVRVGDPNQAIFETFTTASPELLRRFIRENPHVDMPESGRCQPAIIALANHLIDWTMQSHPSADARTALSLPYIKPAPKGDPQPNPENDPAGIRFIAKKFTPEQETAAVAGSLEKWLPDHKDWTVAVLVPRNTRGTELIDALKKRSIETVEFLSSTSTTRAAAGALSYLLAWLADPQSSAKLARAYKVWRRDWREEKELLPLVEGAGDLLRREGAVENFIAPSQAGDWLAGRGESDPHEAPSPGGRERGVRAETDSQDQAPIPTILDELQEFRVHARRWLEAVTLPIDQLILTLAREVFSEPADLALAHKLALVLRKAAEDHPDWRLPELNSELAVIAKNERKFIGFSSDDSGFDPTQYRGKVVVTTMHKAKGLEWDRVYLMSVNNYDFPASMPGDSFISEKWFVRGGLNLEAEALAQLDAALATGEYDWYAEGAATLTARQDYVRERLRLLYVGITRAKRDLIVTWNTGRQGESTQSLAFAALAGWGEGRTRDG
jgi:DNA helicase-2/ATP-dependent DNA helicase PcrA